MAATLRAQQRGRGYRFTRIFDLSQDLFRQNRIFVTLDAIDEIEHLLKFGTEDNLMMGTDYSHTDISANLSALQEVRDWVDQGRISESVARKILETNPKMFYGL